MFLSPFFRVRNGFNFENQKNSQKITVIIYSSSCLLYLTCLFRQGPSIFSIYLGYCVQNALLEFVRVVKAKEQVVAGKLYHLTLEANDVGNKKIYEVKVWVKPWMNFKQLQEFKHVEGGTSSDLSVKQGNGSFYV